MTQTGAWLRRPMTRLYATFAVILVLCLLSLPLVALGWAINTAMAHLAMASDGVRRWGGVR